MDTPRAVERSESEVFAMLSTAAVAVVAVANATVDSTRTLAALTSMVTLIQRFAHHHDSMRFQNSCCLFERFDDVGSLLLHRYTFGNFTSFINNRRQRSVLQNGPL